MKKGKASKNNPLLVRKAKPKAARVSVGDAGRAAGAGGAKAGERGAVSASAYPLPAVYYCQKGGGKTEHRCSVCDAAIPSEPIHPQATLYRECTGGVVCQKCRSADAGSAPGEPMLVMLCAACNSFHPPVEALCEALWCPMCFARQSHTGRCGTYMYSCAVCGSFSNHTTAACPSAQLPTALHAAPATLNPLCGAPPPLAAPQGLLHRFVEGGAGAIDSACLRPSARVPLDDGAPLPAVMAALRGYERVPAAAAARKRRVQCMRCYEHTHATQKCYRHRSG